MRLWAGPPRSAAAKAALAGLFLLAAAAAYLPSLGGGFLWDDDSYVTDNPLLRTPGGLADIWLEPKASPQYYPLVFTTFWAERRLWGDGPLGHRAANVVLHAANAVLLALVLGTLGVPGAWFAGWLFALHPVHVESVAWIAERKNVLSGFFCLGALLAYLRYRGLGGESGPASGADAAGRPRGRRLYAASLALFLGALLSKTVTATLPAAVLAVLWWKEGRLRPRDGWEMLPFALLGAGFGAFTAWLERTHVGAQGAEWALSAADRVLLAGRVPFFYLGKLLWPADLMFVYPRWTLDAGSPWPYLYPAALVLSLGILWRLRHRTGRGTLAAALCFLTTLGPVLGFVDFFPMLFSYVADHFQYLASAAPLALVAAGLARAGAALQPRGAGAGAAAAAVPAVLVVVLGLLTWERAHAFRSPEALWRDAAEKNPGAWLAHTNLGVALESKGQREDAARHYREALRLKPNVPHPRHNLAFLLAEDGRLAEAEEQFRTAWEINTDDYVASVELGKLLDKQGRTAEAERFFREAVRAKPGLAEAQYHLGLLLARTGRVEESIERFRAAREANPGHADTRFNLAVSLEEAGRPAEAEAEYRAVLDLEPAHAGALNNLGSRRGAAGDLEGAARLFRRGVEAHPDDVRLRVNLGRALAAQGRPGEAAVQYREALRLDPGDEAARRGLAEVSASAGR